MLSRLRNVGSEYLSFRAPIITAFSLFRRAVRSTPRSFFIHWSFPLECRFPFACLWSEFSGPRSLHLIMDCLPGVSLVCVFLVIHKSRFSLQNVLPTPGINASFAVSDFLWYRLYILSEFKATPNCLKFQFQGRVSRVIRSIISSKSWSVFREQTFSVNPVV